MKPNHLDPTATPRSADSGLVRLEGPDALDVLHSISTQSLVDLDVGHARATLFCDFRGRLLHRAIVARTGDGSVWLMRDDAPGADLVEHLQRHVFREQVTVADVSAAWQVRSVTGAEQLEPGRLSEQGGVPERIQVDPGLALVITRGGETQASSDDEITERARIAAGRPRHGHEVHPDFNPYEVGLAHEVHLDKGCYTGQEALMRLVTYQSVRRALARIEGAGDAPAASRDVAMDGVKVGVLTSAVARIGGGWIGLAVLRHGALIAGSQIVVAGAGEVENVQPFPITRPLGLPG